MSSFEDVLASISEWTNAANALAATGAELAVLHGGVDVPPEVRDALHAVTVAAGLDGLADLPPQQAQSALGFIRTFLHQAQDVLDQPARAGTWSFTDTAILDGYGRASMMMPVAIAAANPDWEPVRSFLDVGTGVGLLAVSATNVWPECTVVGIDTWEPSLERARKNVADAGLTDRITLRNQNLVDLDDRDAYDLVWVPSFFTSEAVLTESVPALARSLRPGGRVVVALRKDEADPLAAAIAKLESVRNGGSAVSVEQVEALLTDAGLDVRVTTADPAPVYLVIGQRPI